MPLTLIEIKSLIGALGVKIPEDILQQKAKAEEFEDRRKKIVGEAGRQIAQVALKRQVPRRRSKPPTKRPVRNNSIRLSSNLMSANDC